MKKKRFPLFGLLALTLVLSLSACGQDPTTKDYNGKTYSDLQTEMIQHIEYVSLFADQMTAAGITFDDVDDDTMETLAEYGVSEYDLQACDAWNEYINEYGTYVEDDNAIAETLKIAVSGKTTTVDSTIHFGDNTTGKDITIELVYETWSMELTGISVNPVQTLGEKMANAGMNTLISMSIVFAVLVLICLLIYAFKLFPYIEKKKAEKKKAADRAKAIEEAKTKDPGPQEFIPYVPAETPAAAPAGDMELVAVIAAAIAASEGCSTSDFVVRSINRR